MVPHQALFNISNDEQCFDVPIIDDDAREDTENFMLSFDLPIDTEEQDPLAIVIPRMFEVKITDNDEGKWFEVNYVSYIMYYVLLISCAYNR